MSQNNSAVLVALAQVGITIAPNPRAATGWGWAISNSQLAQPWVGPYPTVDETISAVLGWLMTRAWKGTLCIHTHNADDDLAWRPAPNTSEPHSQSIELTNDNPPAHSGQPDVALDQALAQLAAIINALPDVAALLEAEDPTPLNDELLAPWRKALSE